MTDDTVKTELTTKEIIFFYALVLVLFIAGCTMSFMQAYAKGKVEYEEAFFALKEANAFDAKKADAEIRAGMKLPPAGPLPEARKKEYDALLAGKLAAHKKVLEEKKNALSDRHRYLFIWKYPSPDGKREK